MASRDSLGEFETLVLLATVRLGENAYGTTIRREIEHHSRRTVSIGALYSTLDRLETKGLISSSVGEATPERGGRAKKFFELTAVGRSSLQRSIENVNRLSALSAGVLEAV